MLQGLLAERLGLKLHRESRVQPVFELRTAKSGAKLTKSQPASAGSAPIAPRLSTSGDFVYKSITMEKFAETLFASVGQPVINLTGIDGNFDIEMHLAPGTGFGGAMQPSDGSEVTRDESSGISSVLLALQSLGLRLVAGRALIEHLIVDQVDRIHPDN